MKVYCSPICRLLHRKPLPSIFHQPFTLVQKYFRSIVYIYIFFSIYFIYFFSPLNLFFASSNTESSLHTANRK